MAAKLSYTIPEAADATGLSEITIRRAIRAGDLRANRPKVEGREIAKEVILTAELERWLGAEPSASEVA